MPAANRGHGPLLPVAATDILAPIPGPRSAAMTEPAPRVALFVTCLANLFRPAVAFASVDCWSRRAARCTCHWHRPAAASPATTAGRLPARAPLARQLIGTFEGFDYVVVPSGSCAGMIRHHYPRLFATTPWRERALALVAKTFELTAFLRRDASRAGAARAALRGGRDLSRQLRRPARTRHQGAAAALLGAAGVTLTEMQGPRSAAASAALSAPRCRKSRWRWPARNSATPGRGRRDAGRRRPGLPAATSAAARRRAAGRSSSAT